MHAHEHHKPRTHATHAHITHTHTDPSFWGFPHAQKYIYAYTYVHIIGSKSPQRLSKPPGICIPVEIAWYTHLEKPPSIF